MKRAIKRWVNMPAKRWQFWLPQSGFTGGVIAAVVVTLLAAGAGHFVALVLNSGG